MIIYLFIVWNSDIDNDQFLKNDTCNRIHYDVL